MTKISFLLSISINYTKSKEKVIRIDKNDQQIENALILYGVQSGNVGAETVVQCLVMRRTLDPVAAWTLSFGCAIALFPNYIMLATLTFYHNVSSQV